MDYFWFDFLRTLPYPIRLHLGRRFLFPEYCFCKVQYLFVFDLTAGTMYERETVVDENGKERRKTSRTPVYSSEWVGKFGKPVEEHRQAVQINIFDGYAIYGMKQNKGDPDQRRGG